MKKADEFYKQKKAVKSAIIDATEKFKGDNKFHEVKHLSEKAEIILKHCSTWHNTLNNQQGKMLAEMFSAVLGEKIVIGGAVDKVSWTRFAAVVPKNNANAHNYPLDKASIIIGDTFGFRFDGTKGNGMSNDLNNLRPATLEEIDGITDETYAAIIREFLVMA